MKSDFILQNKHFNLLLCELNKLEENRVYCRHDIHHLCEVARIMLIKNKTEQLNINHDIIVATALLHDIGRINEYKFNQDHRTSGLDFARDILLDCNYKNTEIEAICTAISNHNNLSKDTLSALLYRADKLSRACYTCKTKDCYWDSEKRNKEYYK